jgi:hypothetical protein
MSLPSYLPMLLPVNGLTILEAKHLGILTYYLFAMIHLPDTLQDVQFHKSALGSKTNNQPNIGRPAENGPTRIGGTSYPATRDSVI